jgi:hypothetical protein
VTVCRRRVPPNHRLEDALSYEVYTANLEPSEMPPSRGYSELGIAPRIVEKDESTFREHVASQYDRSKARASGRQGGAVDQNEPHATPSELLLELIDRPFVTVSHELADALLLDRRRNNCCSIRLFEPLEKGDRVLGKGGGFFDRYDEGPVTIAVKLFHEMGEADCADSRTKLQDDLWTSPPYGKLEEIYRRGRKRPSTELDVEEQGRKRLISDVLSESSLSPHAGDDGVVQRNNSAHDMEHPQRDSPPPHAGNPNEAEG